MNWKLKTASILLLLNVALFAYLSFHYYPLNFGQGLGEDLPVCSINETFNCDAAATSPYASFMGTPISILGGLTHLAIVLFLIIGSFQLTSRPEQNLRYAFYLSGFTSIIAIIMAVISLTQLSAYCPFCILTYLGSWAAFAFILASQGFSGWQTLKTDLKALLFEARWSLAIILSIPVIGFLLHQAFLDQHGASNVDQIVKASISDWKTQPKIKFDKIASLAKGPTPENATITIVEFADFRCGHCKRTAPTLKAFVNAHPQARMEFFNFPLDGQCNPEISRGNGMSCRLAKATHCAGKQNQEKAWKYHYRIFEEQRAIQRISTKESLDQKLKALAQELSINWNKLKPCIESEETHNIIERQAKVGHLARVRGTPTIYVNGRKLPNGQFIPVLQKAWSESR